MAKSTGTPTWGFDNCNLVAIIVSFSKPNISDLPAFLYTLISKEHALVIKEFPDWVELWVNLLYNETTINAWEQSCNLSEMTRGSQKSTSENEVLWASKVYEEGHNINLFMRT